MLAVTSRKRDAKGSKEMAKAAISECYNFYHSAQEFVEILEPNVLNINCRGFIFFNINGICTRTEFKLHLLTLSPSPHTPNGLNAILTVSFEDDLKSLEAATDSFMNGHFLKNGLHHASRPTHFGNSPCGGRDWRGSQELGWWWGSNWGNHRREVLTDSPRAQRK